jgi:hypothetical protein
MSRVKPSFWIFLGNKSFPSNTLPLFIVGISGLSYSIVLFSFTMPDILPCFTVLIAILILAIGIRLRYEWKKFQELSLIFKNGVETIGEVTEVNFFRNPGYIKYKYEYRQEIYGSVDSLYKNRKTKGINVGQKVMVYVNREKPYEAFIRNLYLYTF